MADSGSAATLRITPCAAAAAERRALEQPQRQRDQRDDRDEPAASRRSSPCGHPRMTALRRVAQAAHALARRDDVGQADAELVVDHHHLALRDQVAVDEHVHRLAGQRVELDHRALRQLQDVLDRDARAAELHRQLHRDVQDHVDVVAAPRRRLPGAKLANGGRRTRSARRPVRAAVGRLGLGQRGGPFGGHLVLARARGIGAALSADMRFSQPAQAASWSTVDRS